MTYAAHSDSVAGTPDLFALPDLLPPTLTEFCRRFGREQACIAAIVRWRWPGGWRCAACGHDQACWLARKKSFQCSACRRQRSITKGTLFEGSHAPLDRWFLALWLFLSSKRGISALELGRQVGIATATAWRWLHKLRAALHSRPKRRLAGLVEVDETYLGGLDEGRPGRSLGKKNPALAAVEHRVPPPGFRRLRMESAPDARRATLESFVNRSIEKGATVLTDAFVGYRHLDTQGYVHMAMDVKASGRPAHEPLPATHRVFSLVRRMLLGTYQAAVRRPYRGAYLAEYEFRFNRREAPSRARLWAEAMRLAVLASPVKCRRIPAFWRGGGEVWRRM